MGRKHRRQVGARRYADFSEANLQKALEELRSNQTSLREAERKYGVPKSTLARKLKGQHQNCYGRPPALSKTEEENLAKGIIIAAKWGFPLTTFDLRLLVKGFLDKKGIEEKRFKNNMPGRDWAESFLRRQSEELKVRISENIKRARAAVTPELIKEYFEELAGSLKDVPPEAIINFDETSFVDDPGKQRVIVRRTCKHPEKIIDSSKSSVSVMFAGSASGHALPPYIVYKSEHLYLSWMEGGPTGTRYNRSRSGWFESAIFEDWMNTIALPYFRKLGDVPKAIIGDNLASHISLNVIQDCESNNIRFILLPPNSTHICQPLDIAYFRPLKMKWRETLLEWKQKNRGCIPKNVFPRLMKTTLDKLGDKSSENLISGFKASGIYPLDQQKVLARLPGTGNHRQPSGNNEEHLWTDTFQEYMEHKRVDETATKQKRKRVDVVPGRSLSCSLNSNEQQNNETDEGSGEQQPGTSKRKRHESVDSSSNEEDSEDISLHDSSSDMELEEMLLVDTQDYDESSDETEKQIDSDGSAGQEDDVQRNTEPQIGDFVCIKLTYDKGTKKETEKMFKGQILNIVGSNLNDCRFMRKYRGQELLSFFQM